MGGDLSGLTGIVAVSDTRWKKLVSGLTSSDKTCCTGCALFLLARPDSSVLLRSVWMQPSIEELGCKKRSSVVSVHVVRVEVLLLLSAP